MKQTKQSNERSFTLEYLDWPEDEKKIARYDGWDNGEGFDFYLGTDKVELSNQEMEVLSILFAQTRLIK